MISKHVPADGTIVRRGNSEVALGISLRAWDDNGHRLVVVQLPGRDLLYGEWSAEFADNDVDFDIAISRFGYLDGDLVGSPDLSARVVLSAAEGREVEALVEAVFSEAAAVRQTMPFLSKTARYSGKVVFAPGWIREQATPSTRR